MKFYPSAVHADKLTPKQSCATSSAFMLGIESARDRSPARSALPLRAVIRSHLDGEVVHDREQEMGQSFHHGSWQLDVQAILQPSPSSIRASDVKILTYLRCTKTHYLQE
jgi:hypothetical protein